MSILLGSWLHQGPQGFLCPTKCCLLNNMEILLANTHKKFKFKFFNLNKTLKV